MTNVINCILLHSLLTNNNWLSEVKAINTYMSNYFCITCWSLIETMGKGIWQELLLKAIIVYMSHAYPSHLPHKFIISNIKALNMVSLDVEPLETFQANSTLTACSHYWQSISDSFVLAHHFTTIITAICCIIVTRFWLLKWVHPVVMSL